MEEWGQFEDAPINVSQLEYIGQLLKHSNIDHDERESIERIMNDLTELEAHELIIKLSWNQLDPIPCGFNYGQRDIVKHQRKLQQ